MRRLILLLSMIFSLTLFVTQANQVHVVRAETTVGFGAEQKSATPEPLQTLEPRFSTEEMLELAEAAARDYGLRVIDGEPEWIWTTRDSELSEWWSDVLLNPNTPLFRVSFRGSGFWGGAGCGDCGPIPINGITFTFDGLTGNVLLAGGGYRSLWSTPVPEITIEPEYTAEPQPTATHFPVTPPPDAMSEAELVAIAKDWAVVNGLETFDGPPLVAWMTQEEWATILGINGSHAPDIVIFIVAFRGTGIYRGIGSGFPGQEPLVMNGFTITLDSLNGHIISTGSAFNAPPFATEYADWAEIE